MSMGMKLDRPLGEIRFRHPDCTCASCIICMPRDVGRGGGGGEGKLGGFRTFNMNTMSWRDS